MTKQLLRVLMGENIRNERLAKKMSIDEMSEMLELTSGFVGLIERGKRGATAFTLYKLSESLEISIDRLFSQTSTRRITPEETAEPQRREFLIKKIESSYNDLSDKELEFLVRTIRGIKDMNHTIRPDYGKQLSDGSE